MISADLSGLVEQLLAVQRNLPPLTRREKRKLGRMRRNCRRQLVRFAGHHRTRSVAEGPIRLHIWPVRLWNFPHHGIPVPRSLRFALGVKVGEPEAITWTRRLRSGDTWVVYDSRLVCESCGVLHIDEGSAT